MEERQSGDLQPGAEVGAHAGLGCEATTPRGGLLRASQRRLQLSAISPLREAGRLTYVPLPCLPPTLVGRLQDRAPPLHRPRSPLLTSPAIPPWLLCRELVLPVQVGRRRVRLGRLVVAAAYRATCDAGGSVVVPCSTPPRRRQPRRGPGGQA